MTVSTPILELRDLSIGFATARGMLNVVTGIDLSIPSGRTLALLGESGCGKTLTALSILRLIDPPGRITRGQILLHGPEGTLDLAALPPEGPQMRAVRGSAIAMIFQEPGGSFTPVYTVGEQIVESILAHGERDAGAAQRLALEMLREVGIHDPARVFAAYPHQLSGGMCQRAMIALALAARPRLLIADEPTTALDVTVQAQVLELMREVQRQHGTSILLITHDMGVVAEMADEVAVMYLGQVVEQGPLEAIYARPLHPYTRGLFSCIPTERHMRGELLTSIPGHVPEPGTWPQGCRFQARCAEAMAQCRTMPTLQAGPGHHAVRCWLHQPAETIEELAR